MRKALIALALMVPFFAAVETAEARAYCPTSLNFYTSRRCNCPPGWKKHSNRAVARCCNAARCFGFRSGRCYFMCRNNQRCISSRCQVPRPGRPKVCPTRNLWFHRSDSCNCPSGWSKHTLYARAICCHARGCYRFNSQRGRCDYVCGRGQKCVSGICRGIVTPKKCALNGAWFHRSHACVCPTGYYKHIMYARATCKKKGGSCNRTACQRFNSRTNRCDYYCNRTTQWCKAGTCVNIPSCAKNRCYYADYHTARCKYRCKPGQLCRNGACWNKPTCQSRLCQRYNSATNRCQYYCGRGQKCVNGACRSTLTCPPSGVARCGAGSAPYRYYYNHGGLRCWRWACKAIRCRTQYCQRYNPRTRRCEWTCRRGKQWCKNGRCVNIPVCDRKQCKTPDYRTLKCRYYCRKGYRCSNGRCLPTRCNLQACQRMDPRTRVCRYSCNTKTQWCKSGRCVNKPLCDRRQCKVADYRTNRCRYYCPKGYRCYSGSCRKGVYCDPRRCQKPNAPRTGCLSTCRPGTTCNNAGRCYCGRREVQSHITRWFNRCLGESWDRVKVGAFQSTKQCQKCFFWEKPQCMTGSQKVRFNWKYSNTKKFHACLKRVFGSDNKCPNRLSYRAVYNSLMTCSSVCNMTFKLYVKNKLRQSQQHPVCFWMKQSQNLNQTVTANIRHVGRECGGCLLNYWKTRVSTP